MSAIDIRRDSSIPHFTSLIEPQHDINRDVLRLADLYSDIGNQHLLMPGENVIMADENSHNIEQKPDPLTPQEQLIKGSLARLSNISGRLWIANKKLLITAAVLLLAITLTLAFWSGNSWNESKKAANAGEHQDEHGLDANEIALSPAAVSAAGIETVIVKSESINSSLRVTGTIEANQEQIQQATPLVSGRVERVTAALGDRVKAGAVLATIASPQIAQLHGKLHEAATKLSLAERNLARVEKAENRVAVLSAKARLDEADANLKRTRRLTDLGIIAGKDLITAETIYKTARAEYEFQTNIALNREIQEARAEVETTRLDVMHSLDELRAYGAPIIKGEHGSHSHNTAKIMLRAPISGTITERNINAGAGIEAGKPLFTIANLANVWVIANVPEAQINQIRIGSEADIYSPLITETSLIGRVTYIDPMVNEETRTAGVRIEVANPQERLKVGSFVEVNFHSAIATEKSGTDIVIPEAAIQRIAERTMVFIPKQHEDGHFVVREIQVGGEAAPGIRRVTCGLMAGERVVTKGSFTLKTQLLKGQMGDHHH